MVKIEQFSLSGPYEVIYELVMVLSKYLRHKARDILIDDIVLVNAYKMAEVLRAFLYIASVVK